MTGETTYDHKGAETCPRCKGSGNDPELESFMQLVCCERAGWVPNSCCGQAVPGRVQAPKPCTTCHGDGLTPRGRKQKAKAETEA